MNPIPHIAVANRLHDIERTFDHLNSLSNWIFGHSSSEGTNARLLSMQEDDNSYTLRYLIPATNKDQIECELEDRRLEIRWTVNLDEVKKRGYTWPTVGAGTWRLPITVPEDVNADPGLVYENETLTVTFKKAAETKKRTLRIT